MFIDEGSRIHIRSSKVQGSSFKDKGSRIQVQKFKSSRIQAQRLKGQRFKDQGPKLRDPGSKQKLKTKTKTKAKVKQKPKQRLRLRLEGFHSC